MKYILATFFIAVSFVSCDHKQSNTNVHIRNTMATIYVQQAPEYIALTQQTYHLARISLDNQLKTASSPLAVVLDIDETVLDNSPYQAKQILENFNYPDYWDEWVEKEEAKPIPGAISFLQHADSLGIIIFYISNRKHHLLKPTINNFKKYNIPQADSSHILLRTTTSSKEDRRNLVVNQGLQIALFVGDNLDDMGAVFETDNLEERNQAVYDHQAYFGTKYFVLPNPTYGKWAQNRGFYNSNVNQDSLAASYLKGF